MAIMQSENAVHRLPTFKVGILAILIIFSSIISANIVFPESQSSSNPKVSIKRSLPWVKKSPTDQ